MNLSKAIRNFAVTTVAASALLVSVTPSMASADPSRASGNAATPIVTPVRDGHGNGVTNQSRIVGTSGTGIYYHNGPILTSGTNVYIIWYGNWSNNTATTILPKLVSGLSGSPYFNINTTYYNSSNVHVKNLVTLMGQTTDAYSQGATNLSDSQINLIVTNAINSKKLPSDPNGLYYVLTSQDVTKQGFLTTYCGWHTHATVGTTDIKYSFVGNPGTNRACAAQTTSSPNNNVGADAMASAIAHELEETATDPGLSAWYDSLGYENGDKCSWTFGTTYRVSNGSSYNMILGGLRFLIQRNWVNAGSGGCVLGY